MPSMRLRFGPPDIRTWCSTSSQIALTWRSLAALAMTNHSQSASTSPTCSTTTSVACLSSAARAAVTAQSRVSSVLLSVRVLRSSGGSDIGAQHDGDIERVRLASVLDDARSEEHTSELQSLMRRSYDVFCL